MATIGALQVSVVKGRNFTFPSGSTSSFVSLELGTVKAKTDTKEFASDEGKKHEVKWLHDLKLPVSIDDNALIARVSCDDPSSDEGIVLGSVEVLLAETSSGGTSVKWYEITNDGLVVGEVCLVLRFIRPPSVGGVLGRGFSLGEGFSSPSSIPLISHSPSTAVDILSTTSSMSSISPSNSLTSSEGSSLPSASTDSSKEAPLVSDANKEKGSSYSTAVLASPSLPLPPPSSPLPFPSLDNVGLVTPPPPSIVPRSIPKPQPPASPLPVPNGNISSINTGANAGKSGVKPNSVDVKPRSFDAKVDNNNNKKKKKVSPFKRVILIGGGLLILAVASIAFNIGRRRPTFYEVKEGDTLCSIAGCHGIKPDDLVDANLDRVDDPDRIFPGDRIYIP